MNKVLALASVLLVSCMMDVDRSNPSSYQLDVKTKVDTLVLDNRDTVVTSFIDTVVFDSTTTVVVRDTSYIAYVDTLVYQHTDTVLVQTKDTVYRLDSVVVAGRVDTVVVVQVDTVVDVQRDTIWHVSEFSLQPRSGSFIDTARGDTITTTILAGYEYFTYYTRIYTTVGGGYTFAEWYDGHLEETHNAGGCPVGWRSPTTQDLDVIFATTRGVHGFPHLYTVFSASKPLYGNYVIIEKFILSDAEYNWIPGMGWNEGSSYTKQEFDCVRKI